DEFIIRLKLRAGKSGEQIGETIDTKADGPRIDGRAQRDLKDELVGAIDNVESNHLGGGGDDDEDEAPAKKTVAKKSSKADKADDEDEATKKAAARKPGKASKPSDDDEDDKPARRSGFSRKL